MPILLRNRKQSTIGFRGAVDAIKYAFNLVGFDPEIECFGVVVDRPDARSRWWPQLGCVSWAVGMTGEIARILLRPSTSILASSTCMSTAAR